MHKLEVEAAQSLKQRVEVEAAQTLKQRVEAAQTLKQRVEAAQEEMQQQVELQEQLEVQLSVVEQSSVGRRMLMSPRSYAVETLHLQESGILHLHAKVPPMALRQEEDG